MWPRKWTHCLQSNNPSESQFVSSQWSRTNVSLPTFAPANSTSASETTRSCKLVTHLSWSSPAQAQLQSALIFKKKKDTVSEIRRNGIRKVWLQKLASQLHDKHRVVRASRQWHDSINNRFGVFPAITILLCDRKCLFDADIDWNLWGETILTMAQLQGAKVVELATELMIHSKVQQVVNGFQPLDAPKTMLKVFYTERAAQSEWVPTWRPRGLFMATTKVCHSSRQTGMTGSPICNHGLDLKQLHSLQSVLFFLLRLFWLFCSWPLPQFCLRSCYFLRSSNTFWRIARCSATTLISWFWRSSCVTANQSRTIHM